MLLDLLDPDLQVVLLTARPERLQHPHRGLAAPLRHPLGRADHAGLGRLRDGRASSSSATVVELRDYGFDLRLAFEDDRRNVAMFRSEGVPCVYFHSGYYD